METKSEKDKDVFDLDLFCFFLFFRCCYYDSLSYDVFQIGLAGHIWRLRNKI